MRLKVVKIKNFRGYKDEVVVPIENDMTAFIGRNDAGKSTILEALEIFFNGKIVKMEPADKNVSSEEVEVSISCVFDDLPASVVVDERHPTSFASEYLLNPDGCIEICKTYKVQKTVSGPAISIRCVHPTANDVDALHAKKLPELKVIGERLGVAGDVDDKRVASLWRAAIWRGVSNLELGEVFLKVDSLESDSKDIFKKLEAELPTFALFKADRESRDEDPEAKNPLQIAVDQAKKDLQGEIERLQNLIESAVLEVAERTKDKLREMDPTLASELQPRFKDKPKWNFNFTLDGEGGVPINKRGSGVRRLVLLNFFRAEAERVSAKIGASRVIYAVEEPETSQHPNYQVMLVEALLALSKRDSSQVLITTHVPALAGLLPVEAVRFVRKDDSGAPSIGYGCDNVLADVVESLGIHPDGRIAQAKAVVLVEGHSDSTFLNHSAEVLKCSGDISSTLADLGIFCIPIGGCGNINHWVSKRFIDQLGLGWGLLLDSDIGDPHNYQKNMDAILDIQSQGRIALATKKREPENYLDPVIFQQLKGVSVTYSETCDAKKIIGAAMVVRPTEVLERYWPLMTADQIKERSKYLDGSVERVEIIEILNTLASLAA